MSDGLTYIWGINTIVNPSYCSLIIIALDIFLISVILLRRCMHVYGLAIDFNQFNADSNIRMRIYVSHIILTRLIMQYVYLIMQQYIF